jgi:DNA-binding NtrC family response regulator
MGKTARVPAIMITAYGDVGMAVKVMKAGAFDFLEKSVRQDELLSSIERALRSLTERPQPVEERKIRFGPKHSAASPKAEMAGRSKAGRAARPRFKGIRPKKSGLQQGRPLIRI